MAGHVIKDFLLGGLADSTRQSMLATFGNIVITRIAHEGLPKVLALLVVGLGVSNGDAHCSNLSSTKDPCPTIRRAIPAIILRSYEV